MTEPTTLTRALIVPNTGDLPGTWSTGALNPDFVAIDAMFGGVTTVSLTNANVVLTVPAGFTATPTAGPTQAQSALLVFNGTLTANCTITFPMPGFYFIFNQCVVGSFVVALASSGAGNIICAPPGEMVMVFNDGTNMNYVGLERVNAYVDLAVSSVPAWISNCSVPPYLNCNGGTFSATTYPNTAAYLGGTTLPDLRGRVRFGLNQGTGVLEPFGTGIDGDVLLSIGGNTQILQEHLPSLVFPVDIPANQGAHIHAVTGGQATGTESGGSGNIYLNNGNVNPLTALTQVLPAMSGSAASDGSDYSYVPPGTAAGIVFIRAG